MLFSIKNRLAPTLLLLLGLTAGSFQLRTFFGLSWRFAPYPGIARQVVLALGAILASDGLLHGALILLFRGRYLPRYQALAGYFRPQGPLEIAGAGLLAAGEELFFRGVLLEALMSRAALGPIPALALSALAFGALHRIRDPRLAPFALWAAWEGVLLGSVYLVFGSLLVSLLVHAAHDVIGFTFFAWRRRAGPRSSHKLSDHR
jgi:membrane protease YdiL (CAAX protease family)